MSLVYVTHDNYATRLSLPDTLQSLSFRQFFHIAVTAAPAWIAVSASELETSSGQVRHPKCVRTLGYGAVCGRRCATALQIVLP